VHAVRSQKRRRCGGREWRRAVHATRWRSGSGMGTARGALVLARARLIACSAFFRRVGTFVLRLAVFTALAIALAALTALGLAGAGLVRVALRRRRCVGTSPFRCVRTLTLSSSFRGMPAPQLAWVPRRRRCCRRCCHFRRCRRLRRVRRRCAVLFSRLTSESHNRTENNHTKPTTHERTPLSRRTEYILPNGFGFSVVTTACSQGHPRRIGSRCVPRRRVTRVRKR